MKQKNNLKRLIITAALFFILFGGIFPGGCPAARTVHAQTPSSIQPMSDVKEWIYKTENGKLYKRLYNTTKGCWEGDWIFVRYV